VPTEVAVESGKPKSPPNSVVAAGRAGTDLPKAGLDATRYVGRPALGTSRAAAAAGIPPSGPEKTELNRQRRRFVWSCVAAFLTSWFFAFLRFFFPRVLFEPATVFKIGYAWGTVSLTDTCSIRPRT
jgi:hypothetical protein